MVGSTPVSYSDEILKAEGIRVGILLLNQPNTLCNVRPPTFKSSFLGNPALLIY